MLQNLSQAQKVAFAAQLAPDLRRLKRQALARQSLAEFVRQGWDILEPGTPLTWNWHLDVICEALERVTRGELKRLLINIPPGMMKSLLVGVFWPAWTWLHRPSFRSVFCAYAQNLSNRDSGKCRQVIGSAWYQALITPDKKGRKWSIDPKTDSVTKFANTSTGFRQCTSVGGTGTGLRANAVVVDDAMNADEFPTPEALEKVRSWWTVRMSSRGAKMKDAVFVIIMQRLHENDLAGYIIEKDKEQALNPSWRPYEKIILPNEFAPDDPNRCPKDPRKVKGELLHPLHFDADDTSMSKATMNEFNYSAQYQQTPVPSGGGVFKCWKLKFWYDQTYVDRHGKPPPSVTLPDSTGELRPCEQGLRPDDREFMLQALSFDCAFKETTTSDFVAGQCWGKTSDSRLYLLDEEHGRMGLVDTVAAVRRLSARNPMAIAKYVEDKANGPAVIQVLKGEGGIFGLQEVNPKGSKEGRAWACSPFVDAGNVWLPHPECRPWVVGLLKEMSSFPRGQHDDRVDAMTQCLLELHEKSIVHLEALCRM